MENLATAFELSATRHRTKPAIYSGADEISYERCLGKAAWFAPSLIRYYEVGPGDRVGLFLRNCPDFVSSLFGILRAGGVVVPINCFLKPLEVSYIIEDAGLTVLITEAALADGLAELVTLHPRLRLLRME